MRLHPDVEVDRTVPEGLDVLGAFTEQPDRDLGCLPSVTLPSVSNASKTVSHLGRRFAGDRTVGADPGADRSRRHGWMTVTPAGVRVVSVASASGTSSREIVRVIRPAGSSAPEATSSSISG
jgi:hypothetical protein